MNMKVFLIVSVLIVVFAAGCIGLGPSVEIASPSNGQILETNIVTVDLSSGNVNIANPTGVAVQGEGYFSVALDGAEQSGTMPSFAFANLVPGEHVIVAELLRGDGSSFEPPVVDSVVITTIAAGTDVVKEFDLKAESGIFEPSEITVDVGDTVIIRIEAVDDKYGFSLGTYDIVEGMEKGETKTISFVAREVGEFNFFCGGFCDASYWDMRGKLIVNP